MAHLTSDMQLLAEGKPVAVSDTVLTSSKLLAEQHSQGVSCLHLPDAFSFQDLQSFVYATSPGAPGDVSGAWQSILVCWSDRLSIWRWQG